MSKIAIRNIALVASLALAVGSTIARMPWSEVVSQKPDRIVKLLYLQDGRTLRQDIHYLKWMPMNEYHVLTPEKLKVLRQLYPPMT